MPRAKREPLDADVYDALEFSALAFDGIGSGTWFEFTNPLSLFPQTITPCCGEGHAIAVCEPWVNNSAGGGEALKALQDIGVTFTKSDDACNAINKRLGTSWDTRVTFEQWAKQLGIVRGPHKYTEPFCPFDVCNDGPCKFFNDTDAVSAE